LPTVRSPYARRIVDCRPLMRIRRTLEQLSVQLAESDPLAAAIRIRGMLNIAA